MELASHGERKYITGKCLGTSKKLQWSNLLVEKWSHKPGVLQGGTPIVTEIGILLEGRAKVRRYGDSQEQIVNAVPGTVWVCPAGVCEDEIEIYGEIKDLAHLYIPSQPFSKTILEEFDLDPDHIHLKYEYSFQDPFMERVGRTMISELQDISAGSDLMISTLQSVLSAHLIKNYSNLAPNEARLTPCAGALDLKRLQRVKEFIVGNIHTNITLEALSQEACLSAFHFARAFKVAVGASPHRYIMVQRINLAKRMIIDHKTSLNDIAYATGFANQSHFTRNFKQETGMTPGAFRSHLKN